MFKTTPVGGLEGLLYPIMCNVLIQMAGEENMVLTQIELKFG